MTISETSCFLSSGFVLSAGICCFAANGPAFGKTSLESGEPVSGLGS